MIEIAISSNKVVTPEGVKRAVILIGNSKILDLVDDIPSGDFEIVDAGDNVLMPAIIDPHVHINEPGRTDWEGFNTATRSAVSGGIGTLIDMPLNSSPVTTNVAAFQRKLQAASNSGIHCNCGFWGGIIPGNENEIENLIQAGVRGFKAFLIHSGIDEFPNVNEKDLMKVMPVLASYNLPLLVHCELQSPHDNAGFNPVTSYAAYANSHPAEWEINAVRLMIDLCRSYNCRTHVVHVSSSETARLIRKAKEDELPITAETAQHYLYFDSAMIDDGRTEFKCAPPIRDKRNQESLWEALSEGTLDFVATDHSPAPPNLKQLDSGNFKKAWGGISSLQFALPALWTRARDRGFTEADVCQWLSSNPSFICGLSHRKGFLKKGYDADLVIWDPTQTFIVKEEQVHHKHKVTPYLGEELYGVVKQTWLAGKKIYADGKFLNLNEGHLILK